MVKTPGSKIKSEFCWKCFTGSYTDRSASFEQFFLSFHHCRQPGMKSPGRRSMDTTCSVCPRLGGFSLCQELMRRSSECFRRLVILWRTSPAYQGLQRKSCWLPVWVPLCARIRYNKTLNCYIYCRVFILIFFFYNLQMPLRLFFCQDTANLPEGASTPALGLSNKAVFQGRLRALQPTVSLLKLRPSDNHFSSKINFYPHSG